MAGPLAKGYMRMTVDVPIEDHTKFKMVCALRRTTISHEIAAVLAAQAEQGDRLLTESLYVAATPELKRELTAYAKAHQMRLADLITEAFTALRENRGEPELPTLPERRARHRRPGKELLARA